MLKKWSAIILLAIGLFLVSSVSSEIVSAQSSFNTFYLDPVEITLVANTNGTTNLYLASKVHNIGPDNLSNIAYRVDSLDASLVYAEVNQQEVSGTSIIEDRFTSVTISFPENLGPNGTADVYFIMEVGDFQSNIILDDAGAYYGVDFLYYIRPINEMHNLTVSLKLPQHSALSSDSVVPIYPEPDFNSTDGFSHLFGWQVDVLRPGQERVFIVEFQFPNLAPAQTVIDTTFQIFFFIGGIALGVVIAIFGPRFYERLKRVGDVRIVGITSEEEEVLDIIRSKGGSCPQKDLYTEMSLSQSKVSIILTNLEERGLIKRFRDGRENMVHILEE